MIRISERECLLIYGIQQTTVERAIMRVRLIESPVALDIAQGFEEALDKRTEVLEAMEDRRVELAAKEERTC